MTTINKKQDLLISEFEPYDDWFDKYEHLIMLGDQLPEMPKANKIDENSVTGCQNLLWIAFELKDGKLLYQADSDAKITRGIIAAVLKVVNNEPPENIVNADFYFIEKIGFTYNLSPSRANGLSAIMKRVTDLAHQACETNKV